MVFALAGVTKLADLGRTRIAMREFGAPSSLATLLAVLIPTLELLVAALLLYGPTRAFGGGGALGLLIVFSGAIAARLARGKAPECHCFGQLHSEPVSWKTLIRNGVFAVFAATALMAGIAGKTSSLTSWIDLSATGALVMTFVVTLTVLTAAGAMAFLSLLRSHGRVLLRVDKLESRMIAAGLSIDENDLVPQLGLEPGTTAPSFRVADSAGKNFSVDELLSPGLPLLLIFTSPSCGPCKALFPKIASWQRTHADRVTIALLSGGDKNASIAEATEHGLDHMLIDDGLAVFDAYRANGTPSAVLVAADGTIASYVVAGVERVEQLLESAVAEHDESEVQGLSVGSPAPQIELPLLDGNQLNLGNLRERTLVLFWNPACGFCNSMRDDLRAWERNVPAGAPRLVIVSAADEASVRGEGFLSSVAIDSDFSAGTSFGAGGTPMAILIDHEGRIASPLAAGAEAVFALAGGRGRSHANGDALSASAKR